MTDQELRENLAEFIDNLPEEKRQALERHSGFFAWYTNSDQSVIYEKQMWAAYYGGSKDSKAGWVLDRHGKPALFGTEARVPVGNNYRAFPLFLTISKRSAGGWRPEGYTDSKDRIHSMLVDNMKTLGLGDGQRGYVEHDEDGKVRKDLMSLEGELYFAFLAITEELAALNLKIKELNEELKR